MSYQYVVMDCEESRAAKLMMAWADEKISLASKGEIFDVPVGHDAFMNRVYEIRQEAEDMLLEHTALRVMN